MAPATTRATAAPRSRTGRARLFGNAGADVFTPEVGGRRDRVEVRGGDGADRLAPGASLKAAPHRSLVVIDARSGRVTTKAGTRIAFSSVNSFGFAGSTETRIHWWGSKRSDVLRFTEQYGPVRASGGWGRDLLDGGERLNSCKVRR